MYLEISARRSGKTRRLVNYTRRKLNQGYNMVIVLPKYSWANFLLPQDLKYHDNLTVSSRDLMHDLIKKLKKRGEFEYTNWVFDEFDHSWSDRITLPIFETGYYVTTPKFVRTTDNIAGWHKGIYQDCLLDLLKANKWHYAAYMLDLHYEDISGMIEDVTETLPEELFAREFGHQIFKK